MNAYIEVLIDNIIIEGQTTISEYCDKKYVIYVNTAESRQKIRINTDYYKSDNKIKLCKYYDRGLCNTIEEFRNLSLEYIESQAYGSWMDGAR